MSPAKDRTGRLHRDRLIIKTKITMYVHGSIGIPASVLFVHEYFQFSRLHADGYMTKEPCNGEFDRLDIDAIRNRCQTLDPKGSLLIANHYV